MKYTTICGVTFIALSTQYDFLVLEKQADVEHSGVIAVLLL